MIRHRVRLVQALLAVLAVALVPASELGAQGKGTIKIATQSPLSGGQAALGEGIKLGAQLALEQLRGNLTKQGFKVELVPFDDQAKPDDIVYFGGIYAQGGPFFKQAREKGVKAKFLGPDGLDSSDLVKIGGKTLVGLYYTTAAAPSTSPQAKKFGDDFKKKFGKNP